MAKPYSTRHLEIRTDAWQRFERAIDVVRMVANRPAGLPEIEIQITPEMIQAGVYAARDHCLGTSLADLAAKIYIAMAIESHRTRPSASEDHNTTIAELDMIEARTHRAARALR